MSSNWQWLTLGEVVSIEIGRTPSRSDPTMWDPARQSGAVWVSIADLTACEGRVISDSKEYISSLATVAGKPVRAGTLMMSFKLSIGKLAFAGTDLYTNEAIAALTVKDPDRLSSAFLFHFLSHVDWVSLSAGNEKVKGATLNKAKLAVVPVPVPPLAEQKRIVAKLDEVDADLRTLSERLDTELLQSAQVRLSAMNELLDQNRGKKVKLGDILSLEYGKPLDPSRRDSSAAVPVYGANGVKTFTSRALYEEPTIVVGRKGSAGELALTDGPCWPLDVTYYVVHDRAVTDRVFLHTLLKKCDLPRLAKGVKPGINRNEVYELECLLPSLAEQQQIVARLGEVDSVCAEVSENIERRKAKAGELRQSVLAAAFRGGL